MTGKREDSPIKREQGQVQVYTGNGKGKTTAALGLALRAVGHGCQVCLVQFMKGGGPYGEHLAAERLAPHLTVFRTGRPGWVRKGNPDPADVAEAREALELARIALTSGRYDMVVLDEINGAIDFGLLTVEKVLALLTQRPPNVELILTGRNANPQLLAAADLVTEMLEVKHYFQQGVPARQGIEC